MKQNIYVFVFFAFTKLCSTNFIVEEKIDATKRFTYYQLRFENEWLHIFDACDKSINLLNSCIKELFEEKNELQWNLVDKNFFLSHKRKDDFF